MERSWIWLSALVVALAAPVLYWTLQPTYLAEISLYPTYDRNAVLQTKPQLVRVGDGGVAFFDFRALLPNSGGRKLVLGIRPDASPTFYPQKQCCTSSSDGMISGEAQLGDVKFRLRQNEKYTFQLSDSAGGIVLEGQITADVYKLLNGSSWIILAIGFLASLIQIVDWLRRRLTMQNTAQPRSES